jgi:proline racemase
MAALHAKGKLKIGEEFINESIIGTLFKGRLVKETTVGNVKAVVPEVTGSAYITAFSQMVVDPSDPLRNGFLLGTLG